MCEYRRYFAHHTIDSFAEISKQEKPDGLPENKKVARRGGKVAGNARKDTEKEIGRSVISKKNYLQLSATKKVRNK